MSEESKVRLWIWGGFMSVLVLLAVVGAVSFFSFEATVGKFGESGRVGQSTAQLLLADRNVASLRSYALRYLSDNDESLLKLYHQRKDSATAALTEATALIQAAEPRQRLHRVHELVASFDAHFEEAVKLLAHKIAAVKDADAIGHHGRSILDEFSQTYHVEAGAMLPIETLMRARLDLARVAGNYDASKAKEGIELGAAFIKEVKDFTAAQPADRQAKLADLAVVADNFATGLANAFTVTYELKLLTDQVMETVGKEISSTSMALRLLQVKNQEEIDESARNYVLHAKITIGVLTIIAIIIAIFCAILISTIVSRPISAMATAARAAAEIGELIKLAAQDGDFRNRSPTEGRTGFVATISFAVNRLFDSVCIAFDAIGRDAGKVALAASDASGAVVEVNAGAAEQARSLEQVREAIRMSAEAITKVSSSATAASTISDQASGLANRGQITIEEMADLMDTSFRNNRELLKLAHTLAHTVTKVDYLASTVVGEAFKLGEPGRDFAAVCQQVCTLTQETHSSAVKISELVETTNRDLQAGAHAGSSARQLINEIRQRVAETDGMIRSIAETMLAQQSAILEIDATTNSLAEIGDHNVEAGEQISRRLVELRDISSATKAAISAFQIELVPAPDTGAPAAG